MFSRIITLVLTSIFVSSCSMPVNEEPPPRRPPGGIENKLQCLGGVLPVIESFLKGDSELQAVQSVWSCFAFAINEFTKSVRGRSYHEYQATELRSFFEKYFLKDVKVSDRLLLEIMHLKQLFIGGSADRFTRDDLQELISFSYFMRDLTAEIHPYMKIYSQNWSILNSSISFFEDANRSMQSVAKKLALRVERYGVGYQLSHLTVFFEEMSKLYGSPMKIVDFLNRTLPLIGELKKTLAGGSEDTVAPTEWKSFALLTSRGFIQYLRYYYFLQLPEKKWNSFELAFAIQSVSDVISMLQDLVSGKPGQQILISEINQVMRSVKRLFPEFNVSEELVTEIMRIKTVLIGGQIESWTSSDFVNAQAKLPIYQKVIESIFKYSSFYTFNSKPTAISESYFAEAEQSLLSSSLQLATLFESSYDLRSVSALMEEIKKTLPKDVHFPNAVIRFQSALVGFRQLVFADQKFLVSRNQWGAFLNQASRFFLQVLYYQYFLRDQEVVTQVPSWKIFLDKTQVHLRELLSARGKNISSDEINQLIQKLVESELIPGPSSIYSSSVDVIVNRFLNPTLDRQPDSINLHSLDWLATQLNNWWDTQLQIALIFSSRASMHPKDLADRLRQTQDAGAMELSDYLRSVPVATPMNDWLVPIDSSVHLVDKQSLTRLNMIRLIVRWLIISYAFRGKDSVTSDAMDLFYRQIRPTLEGIGLIHNASREFARNRFFEANVFTFHGDGNQQLNLNEGINLFSLIFSGLKTHTKIMNFIKAQGCVISNEDWMVNQDCLMRVYRENMTSVFSYLPEFSSQVSSYPEEKLKTFFDNNLKAVGYIPKNGLIGESDYLLVPHIFQYIESVMQRFDLNKDSIINLEESILAYPIYRDLIKSISPFRKDEDNLSLFAYLLKRGRGPKSAREIGCFIFYWKNDRSLWKVSADRFQLAMVLGSIAEEVQNSKLIYEFPIDVSPPDSLASCRFD